MEGLQLRVRTNKGRKAPAGPKKKVLILRVCVYNASFESSKVSTIPRIKSLKVFETLQPFTFLRQPVNKSEFSWILYKQKTMKPSKRFFGAARGGHNCLQKGARVFTASSHLKNNLTSILHAWRKTPVYLCFNKRFFLSNIQPGR